MTISTTFHGWSPHGINHGFNERLNQMSEIDDYKNATSKGKETKQQVARECEKMFFQQFLQAIVPQEDSFMSQGVWGGLHRSLFIKSLNATELSSCLGLKNTILNHLDALDHPTIGE